MRVDLLKQVYNESNVLSCIIESMFSIICFPARLITMVIISMSEMKKVITVSIMKLEV